MTAQELKDHQAHMIAISNQVLQSLPQNVPHEMLIEALINCFLCMAEAYPCCTAIASKAAWAVAQRLEKAASGRPANAPVH